jgi:hypothetical protein
MCVAVYHVRNRLLRDGSDCGEQSLAGFGREVRIEYKDGMLKNYNTRVADGVPVRVHNLRINIIGEFGKFGTLLCGRMRTKHPSHGKEKTAANRESLYQS